MISTQLKTPIIAIFDATAMFPDRSWSQDRDFFVSLCSVQDNRVRNNKNPRKKWLNNCKKRFFHQKRENPRELQKSTKSSFGKSRISVCWDLTIVLRLCQKQYNNISSEISCTRKWLNSSNTVKKRKNQKKISLPHFRQRCTGLRYRYDFFFLFIQLKYIFLGSKKVVRRL